MIFLPLMFLRYSLDNYQSEVSKQNSPSLGAAGWLRDLFCSLCAWFSLDQCFVESENGQQSVTVLEQHRPHVLH